MMVDARSRELLSGRLMPAGKAAREASHQWPQSTNWMVEQCLPRCYSIAPPSKASSQPSCGCADVCGRAQKQARGAAAQGGCKEEGRLTKVTQLEAILVQEDVLCLEVPVQDVLGVHILYGQDHLHPMDGFQNTVSYVCLAV